MCASRNTLSAVMGQQLMGGEGDDTGRVGLFKEAFLEVKEQKLGGSS